MDIEARNHIINVLTKKPDETGKRGETGKASGVDGTVRAALTEYLNNSKSDREQFVTDRLKTFSFTREPIADIEPKSEVSQESDDNWVSIESSGLQGDRQPYINGDTAAFSDGGPTDDDGPLYVGDDVLRGRVEPKQVLSVTAKVLKWVLIYMGRFAATVLKTSIVIILVLGFGVIGAGVGAVFAYLENVEPLDDISLDMRIQTSYIYDADGNQIANLTGSSNINRQLVKYEDISPYLVEALIAIEDKRFDSHNGIDLRRIVGAGLQFVTGGSDAHGASTITQQLVKNVTGRKNETLERKVQEWYLATELEKRMVKWKILELYLNVVYFGNGSYGVSSAARTYFGKTAGELSAAESAFMIGITNSPGLYNPYTEKGLANAYKRQRVILSEMYNQGAIETESEYQAALDEKLTIVPKSVTTDVITKPQSYFVDCVIEEVKNDLMSEKGMTAEMAFAQIYNYGLRIYTTQNQTAQAVVDRVYRDEAYFPLTNEEARKNNEQPQGAMVILDPYTAQIRAISGGSGEKLADRVFNRATQARRQPGSGIKPIAVFGPALDQRVISLATVIDDTPTHYDPNDPARLYPRNSSGDYRGLTTVRDAIRRSVNTAAVKIWLQIPDTSRSYMSKLGINRDSETQIAFALGGLSKGVTPLEMAAAYVPFVNRGMYYTPSTYTKVLDGDGRVILDKTVRLPQIVFSEQTAYLMTSALQDVVKSGTGTQAALFDGSMPVAGKTGTTNDNADRWFIGYTPYYVAATWYGYDNYIKKIVLEDDELGNAMKIWKSVMEEIHKDLPAKDFTMPDNIVTANVCAYSGLTPTHLCAADPRGSAVRTEYFAQGTQPRDTELCDVHVSVPICGVASDLLGYNVDFGEYCPREGLRTRVMTRRHVPFVAQSGDPYPTDWGYEYQEMPSCPYHSTDETGGIVSDEGEDGSGTDGEGEAEGENGSAVSNDDNDPNGIDNSDGGENVNSGESGVGNGGDAYGRGTDSGLESPDAEDSDVNSAEHAEGEDGADGGGNTGTAGVTTVGSSNNADAGIGNDDTDTTTATPRRTPRPARRAAD